MPPLLASGARDATLCLWDMQQRRCRLRVRQHRAALSACAFLDASTVVTGSLDRTLLLCDLASGSRVRCFDDHDAAVTSVVRLSPSLVASGSSDAAIKLFDVRADRPCVATLFDHEAAVYDLAAMMEPDADASAAATQLLSASWDRSIKLWNLRMLPAAGSDGAGSSNESKRCVRTLRGHTDAVRALVVMDGSTFASAGWDKTIRVWDLSVNSDSDASSVSAPLVDAACVGSITGHSSWIYSLAYLPESGQIVSASGDKTLRISDPETMRTHTVLTGHQNTIWSVVTLPSISSAANASAASSSAAVSAAPLPSSLIVSGGADSQLRLWDPVAKDCTRLSGGHASDTAIHALDVWPAPAFNAPNRKRLNLRQRCSQSMADSCSTAAAAAASSADVAPSDASSPLVLSDALERHGSFAFMRQSETETTYKSKDSAAAVTDTLEQEFSRVRLASQKDRIPSAFTIVPAGFNSPDFAAEAAAPPTAAPSSANDAASAAPAPASGSAPTSAPCVDLLSSLATLRLRALSFASSNAWTDTEKSLLEMIAEVEAAQEAAPVARDFLKADSPSSPTAAARPSTAVLSQMLFCLFHDASVVACKQGVPNAALRYATQALGCYDASADDDDDAADGARAQRERAVLLDTQQTSAQQQGDADTIDEFGSLIPSELALQSQHSLFAPLSSGAAPSSPAAPAVSTQHFLLPLLLRRFHSAYMLRDVPLCFELGTQLLSRLSSRDQARETMLDEIESIVLRSPAARPKPGLHLPPKCLYALLLHLWHEEVLVAHAARKMEEINAAKTKGNELFVAASTAAATAAAPAGVSDTAAAAGPKVAVSDPAGALVEYARGLLLAHDLEDLFGDAEACPSYAWFELRAAQIPATQQRAASGIWLLFGGNAGSVPPFSRPALSFLHATLYSNYAQALLSATDAAFLSASHRECILALHAAQTRHRKVLPVHESFAPLAHRLAWTKRVAEQGIARMEQLGRKLEMLRDQVRQAQRSKYQGLTAASRTHASNHDEEDDDEEDRNVFVENMTLGLALPSLSVCSALASKLYFRHGAACLSMHDHGDDDSLAEASFALSQKLHPDPKVQREIERRKRERAASRKQQAALAIRDPLSNAAVKSTEEKQKEQPH